MTDSNSSFDDDLDDDLDDIVTGPIEVVGCRAAGEIGDVNVGGIAVPPGDTVWDQSRWSHETNGCVG